MKLLSLFSLTLLIVLPVNATSLPSEKRKTGKLMQSVLGPVQLSLQGSSAVFYNDKSRTNFIYGTVISEDGYILTKASELDEVKDFHVRVGSRKYSQPKRIASNEQWDVALIKIDASDLRPVDLSGSSELDHGTWVVANGATERRFRRPRAGVISANKRTIKGGNTAVLGVQFQSSDEGIIINAVTENSGAEKAGLKEGDLLLKAEGEEIGEIDVILKLLKSKSVGESFSIEVKREEEVMSFKVELMARHKLYKGVRDRNDQMSGGEAQQSPRRTNFPLVLQHEIMLTRRTVGGPLFTLDGEFVGMNIAAANRVEAFAIPVEEIAKLWEEMNPAEK